MRRRDFSLGFVMAAAKAPRERKLLEAAGLIQQAVDAGQVRAAVLHVRRRTERFERAFGQARTPDTVFLIASITKPMTAAGVMLLADRGELSVGDPVYRFIPEFSGGDRKLVTIRHLLTHTSGLPDMLPENTALRERHAPLSEFVERTIRTPLLFKPGTRVQYQSMGILLAAEIARRVTGRPFAEYLEKEIFRPLGMTNTALGLGRFEIAGTARCQVEEAPGLYGGGRSDARNWDWNSPYWRNLAAPWGGAHSTGADIASFFGCFLKPDGRVLRAETAAAMVTNQTQGLNEPRGIGFAVAPGSFGKACSARTFGHGGSTGTIAWADPETDLVCVVLTTLPARLSEKSLLKPVSDKISES